MGSDASDGAKVIWEHGADTVELLQKLKQWVMAASEGELERSEEGREEDQTHIEYKQSKRQTAHKERDEPQERIIIPLRAMLRSSVLVVRVVLFFGGGGGSRRGGSGRRHFCVV